MHLDRCIDKYKELNMDGEADGCKESERERERGQGI